MADTTKLSREERKKAKRVARKELKKLYADLTPKQLDDFKSKNKGGVKGFLAGTNEDAE